jgi:hypothetical protein
MGGKTSKYISVLPAESFQTIIQDKSSKTASTVRDNIQAGYLYLVLPPKTSLNNFEKFGGKLIVHLQIEGEPKLDSVCIDNTVGIHVIGLKQKKTQRK